MPFAASVPSTIIDNDAREGDVLNGHNPRRVASLLLETLFTAIFLDLLLTPIRPLGL